MRAVEGRSRLGLMLRTARHLRWSQVLWRTHYSLERRDSALARRLARRWRWDGRVPPPLDGRFPDVPLLHRLGPSGEDLLPELERGEFEHLNRRCRIGYEDPDWRMGRVPRDRLWTLSLYYHEWVHVLAEIAAGNGPEAGRAGRLLEHYLGRWLARCRVGEPGTLHLAWNSFAVATRLTWWIRALRQLGQGGGVAGVFLRRVLPGEIWSHASWLAAHVEWDLLGNHLLRDAVGLAWAGRFFSGSVPGRWLDLASRIASGQIDAQVMADGGHCERSPMYHIQVMEDLISLRLLLEEPDLLLRVDDALRRMARCLSWLRHPDGTIALLNDSALGAQCEAGRMLETAARITGCPTEAPAEGATHLEDFGLVIARGSPWTVFFDVGPLGPDWQPGHAHADNLSVVCSFRGRRLFVDAGTWGYDDDERRRYDRSTASHNTVCVDGTDSSEMWSIFRVARRARPRQVEVRLSGSEVWATASHDGYDDLPGRPGHARTLRACNPGAIRITDLVEGAGSHRLEGGLLVAPGWRVTGSPGGWTLERDGRRVGVRMAGGEDLTLSTDRALYHPEFGREEATARLVWRWEGRLPKRVETVLEEAR